jgi:ribonuclease T2
MLLRTFATLIGIAAFALVAALAQRAPWPSEILDPQKRADVAGEFDYYVLVLSWSPTHCQTAASGEHDMQCARRDGRRFGFVLHGLWPQYEAGYPLRCRTRWRPYVPEPVIGQMRDVMPSRGLVIHEYRTHGTCSGLLPAPYFALARQLYNRIQIPKRYRNPFDRQFIEPREVLADFLSANPGLEPDMIAVTCGDNRLSDVRICMTKDGRPRRCSASALPRARCRAGKMHVPPVRSTWRPGGSRTLDEPGGALPLPQPRIIESPRPF